MVRNGKTAVTGRKTRAQIKPLRCALLCKGGAGIVAKAFERACSAGLQRKSARNVQLGKPRHGAIHLGAERCRKQICRTAACKVCGECHAISLKRTERYPCTGKLRPHPQHGMARRRNCIELCRRIPQQCGCLFIRSALCTEIAQRFLFAELHSVLPKMWQRFAIMRPAMSGRFMV